MFKFKLKYQPTVWFPSCSCDLWLWCAWSPPSLASCGHWSPRCLIPVRMMWLLSGKKIFYNIYSDITTSEVKAQNEDKHMMLQTMFIIHIFISLLDNYWSGIVPFTDIKISSSEQLLVFFIYSRHMTIIISSGCILYTQYIMPVCGIV